MYKLAYFTASFNLFLLLIAECSAINTKEKKYAGNQKELSNGIW